MVIFWSRVRALLFPFLFLLVSCLLRSTVVGLEQAGLLSVADASSQAVGIHRAKEHGAETLAVENSESS